MVSKDTKRHFKRRLRKSRKQVEDLSAQADKHFERHFASRLGRLMQVWRFLAAWLGLSFLLIGAVFVQTLDLSKYYQVTKPIAGGIYSEGILGDFTTANPIYATGAVDSAVSKLVFASLLTYNQQNQLTGDLAKSWSVDPSGKIYTVNLKPNLKWQDGKPLTAADVVFTYQMIQNPDAGSPLNADWQDVVVSEVNPLTVTFTLTNQLTSFPYSLTGGILPEHLLANVPPDQLRTANFNTAPVGSGPFIFNSLAVQGDQPQNRQEDITLLPYTGYNNGKPLLNQFTVRAFHNQNDLVKSFQQGEIDGISGLDSVPSALAKDKSLQIYNMPLTAANMVFFKTTTGVLADKAVRKALVQAAQVNQIINSLGYPTIPVREPLLAGQIGYNPSYQQSTGNPLAAQQILTKDKWQAGSNGTLYKDGQPLEFELVAADNQDNHLVASQLQKNWRAIGADARVVYQPSSTLQDTLAYHNYDALLYGISIGVDPDVFVYWDSSQASLNAPLHLNFSEYQSSVADNSLEAGRIRSDPQIRAIKYQPFLQAWQQDAPALGLYQPRYLYISDEPVYGLNEHTINDATDRFNNVQDWAVRLGTVSY